jgi:hypothetical protein
VAGRRFPLAIRHPREGRSHPPPGFFSRAPRGRILLLGSPSVTTGIRATAGFPAAKALLLAGPRRSTVRSGPWPRRRAVPDPPTRKGLNSPCWSVDWNFVPVGEGREASRRSSAASPTRGDGPGSGEAALAWLVAQPCLSSWRGRDEGRGRGGLQRLEQLLEPCLPFRCGQHLWRGRRVGNRKRVVRTGRTSTATGSRNKARACGKEGRRWRVSAPRAAVQGSSMRPVSSLLPAVTR